jgi:streptomycin 6-kinase
LGPARSAERERLVRRFGEAVVGPWWDALPAWLDELAARWELEIGEPVGRGNTSLALWCRRGGARAVLKLTPEPAIAVAEAQALRAWARTGRVPAVHAAEGGAVLLEALDGEPPRRVDGIAELIRTLQSSDPADVPAAVPLAERVEFIFSRRRGGDPALARALAAEDAPPVLLHGDLHARNLLATPRGLVALDPRPCVGDAAFDAVDFVFLGSDDPREWAARCHTLAAALGTTADRIRRWCVAFYAERSSAIDTAWISDPTSRARPGPCR